MRKAHRRRLGEIEREVLEQLTMGDLMVGFLCSAMSTRRMYKIARDRAYRRERIRQAVDRLEHDGLVHRSGDSLSITTVGARLVTHAIETTRKRLGRTAWDQKWRIVAFDIPEQLRTSRNHVRSILRSAGFQRLQQSIWIFPHDCTELTELLQQDTRVRPYVLYGVLEIPGIDSVLRRRFEL